MCALQRVLWAGGVAAHAAPQEMVIVLALLSAATEELWEMQRTMLPGARARGLMKNYVTAKEQSKPDPIWFNVNTAVPGQLGPLGAL